MTSPILERSSSISPAADPVADPLEQITVRQVILATLTVLAVGVAFWMSWRFRFILFALITAVFLHIAMKPAVEALFRRGVRRQLGVVLVYSLLVLAVLALLLTIVPMLADQVGTFTAKLPDYYRIVRNFMLQSDIDLLSRLARLLPPSSDMAGVQTIVVESTQSGATVAQDPWKLVGQMGQGIFFTIAVFAMALYLTLDRDRILYNLLLRLPMERRDSVREIVGEIENKVGAFMRGQLLLCAVVGLLSLAAYFAIGLPYAIALGALAFIFEAVPLIGPLLAAIPAAIVAATVGPDKLVWVLAAVTVIQVAENNVLVPRIMDKAVGVNAIVSILAITAFSLLFGILGALLAIPLAAMIQLFIDRYFFAVGSGPAEEEVESLAPLEMGGTRGEMDVLRLEAAELAQDVRKQLRAADAGASPGFDAIEDLIELTADELVALLNPAEPAQDAPQRQPAPQIGAQMGAR